jgi:hypothetical protein
MDPVNDYYGMEMWKRMLGMQAPYGQPPNMQYIGGQQQGHRQQSSSMNTNMLKQLMGSGSTATGMTPNATNAMGEPYYGWGAQTGDWGATSSGLVSGAEIPSTAGEVGGGVADVAGGGSSYLPLAGYVAAAIAGQHMMSGATDRRTMEGGESGTKAGKGHRTGDVFSGDFFTEPWMAWGEQQLGIDTPTAGEKTDAAIDRLREGKGGFSDFASTIPGTAYQWFDPVGNFAGDFMGDKFGTAGKVVTSLLLPQTGLKWLGDWIGGLF